jgi:hypothetical protein
MIMKRLLERRWIECRGTEKDISFRITEEGWRQEARIPDGRKRPECELLQICGVRFFARGIGVDTRTSCAAGFGREVLDPKFARAAS